MTSHTGPTMAPAVKSVHSLSSPAILRKRSLSTDSHERTTPDKRSMPKSVQLQRWNSASSVLEESDTNQRKSPPPPSCSASTTHSRVDSLDLHDNEPPELQLPPLLYPLTESNLRQHTAQTSPESGSTVDMAPSTTQGFDRRTSLEAYGVIIGEYASYPEDITKFIADVIKRPRAHETPGAQKLHNIQTLAKSYKSEAKTVQMIEKFLMFREEYHDLGGERHISQSLDVNLDKIYVSHKETRLSLTQPRPDIANGYVAYRQQQISEGALHSPFTLAEELIIREDTIHDDVLFPWLTAQFKSAMGESIEIALLQCARDGVAINNYLRCFLERANQPADALSTMHWSIACDVNSAQLFCHWQGDTGEYYMKRVCSADLRAYNPGEEDRNPQMVLMRKYLRNLLEYVQKERLDMLKGAICAIQAKRDGAKAKDPMNGKSGTSSASRKSSGYGSMSTGSPTKRRKAGE